MAILSRKKKKKRSSRITDFFWPKIGWMRTLEYYKKRIFRISDSPHGIAAGIATGIAVSCTPFVGFHLGLIVVLCLLTRGNVLAGFLSSLIGNPATFPFIWLFCYFLGCLILGIPIEGNPLKHGLNTDFLMDNLMTIFLPMSLGGIIVGIILWVFFYFITERTISRFQAARKKRLAEKRKMFQSLRDKFPRLPSRDKNE